MRNALLTFRVCIVMCLAVVEAIYGLATWFFRRRRTEIPTLTFIDNQLNNAIYQHMQHVLARFTPSPWAPGPFSQSVLANTIARPKRSYTRHEILALDDGVEVHVDWKESSSMHNNTPILFVCHGISGCSETRFPWIISDAAYERGWRTVVYNRRGHKAAPITPRSNPDLMSSCKGYPIHCDTADMHATVCHVHAQFPDAPKVLLGTSAGGNVAVRYLSEYADKHPFTGAVSSANGYHLDEVSRDLASNRRCADALLVSLLLGLLRSRWSCARSLAKHRQLDIDFDSLLSCVSVRELEEKLVLPFHPMYESLQDYYVRNSSHEALDDVGIPLLCMNALDDILVKPELAHLAAKAAERNPNVFAVVTKQGGHAGWLEGWDGRSWEVKAIMHFVSAVLELRTT